MPQLEQVATYVSQVFWLVVTFGLLYIILWKAALPKVADLLRERQDRIDGDLQKARQLKEEAETVLQAYEAAMAEARSQAQDILRQAADAAGKEAEQRHATLSAKLAKDADAAEARIDAARKEALANVRAVAAEAAREATSRLIGGSVSEADAEAAVTKALEGSA